MAHIRIAHDQTDKQMVNLIKTLLQSRRGCEYNAIKASMFFLHEYGIEADWHIFATILDQMAMNGLAVSDHNDIEGHVHYIINSGNETHLDPRLDIQAPDFPCPECHGEVGHRINCQRGIAFTRRNK